MIFFYQCPKVGPRSPNNKDFIENNSWSGKNVEIYLRQKCRDKLQHDLLYFLCEILKKVVAVSIFGSRLSAHDTQLTHRVCILIYSALERVCKFSYTLAAS